MPYINFVHYLRPNGKRVLARIDRPDNIAKAADLIISHGFRFAMELLTDNYTVSLTIEDDDDDYMIVLTPNAPGAVEAAVDAMISTFDLAEAIKARKKNAH